jgi:hypothetical protein
MMEGKPSTYQAVPAYRTTPAKVGGKWVVMTGEPFFKIEAFHRLKPFFMSLPSDTDLWMFIASGGGLTAGRVDADGALFPYQTVDLLHDAHHHTGPVTLMRVESGGSAHVLWEPFCSANDENPAVERNLYKSAWGNRLVFEEINHDLKLAFKYEWASCEEFGWVRTATLANLGHETRRATLLDGLRNILPFGAPLGLYQSTSTLVDAYKRTDVDPETGLGFFSLTAGITDRAEAMEVLRANTVWCRGLEQNRIHLSSRTVDDFRQGRVLSGEQVLKGGRGNYLVSSFLELAAGQELTWHMAADVGLDHSRIADLRAQLQDEAKLAADLGCALAAASENLCRLVAGGDAMQLAGDAACSGHHFANVLFNSMRGGIFQDNYRLPTGDFRDFLLSRNTAVARVHESLLSGLPEKITIQELRDIARDSGDDDLQRLCLEYLPLHFGRRHGDPSRPWNIFNIRVRKEDGSPALDYQGNWRDIFQNWEALGMSYPDFLPHFVAKFVNASTTDGYNPYRISRAGVDWEIEEPDDPWSNIGYWGDHQIIYLLKLLESWRDHEPDGISAMLDREIFSYANVPYRLKSFADMVADPSDTIIFDDDLDRTINARLPEEGSDARLVRDGKGGIYHANLFEKLVVPALTKLSNFVPQAGIWMNTQRPEWNDANNALAGGGVSMVTLCYLRRYLAFVADILDQAGDLPLPVSNEVITWFEEVAETLDREHDLLGQKNLTAEDRYRVLNSLGQAYSYYRQRVYANGFTGKKRLSTEWVATVFRRSLEILDATIRDNKRPDGLYHTYNLLDLDAGRQTGEVRRLQAMLEGQVAVLSSGVISPEEAAELLTAMFASPLYRADQDSFLLYPERTLPSFLEKNVVPPDNVEQIPLLSQMLRSDDESLILRDADGVFRFPGHFRHAEDVEQALAQVSADPNWAHLSRRDGELVLELFEKVFQHHRYTGRSGYMYGYEGIGCIYWHMVSKLLLAVQEVRQQAARSAAPAETRASLRKLYNRVRDGLGFRKTVEQYGAFPSDPYSHTPADGGARQPGMTGQVKEEIIARRGELGLDVKSGCLIFRPEGLEAAEFQTSAGSFRYYDVDGEAHELAVPADALAFTCCQVPVVYRKGAGNGRIRVQSSDGKTRDLAGLELDAALSAEIFSRSGRVICLEVELPAARLLAD